MGLFDAFAPSKKRPVSTGDKTFVCTECESEYDTKEEAEQCCASTEESSSERNTNEDDKPYSPKDFIEYSKSGKYAMLFIDDIYDNSNGVDEDDLENSFTTWLFECLDELDSKGYTFVRDIVFVENNGYIGSLYIKRGEMA